MSYHCGGRIIFIANQIRREIDNIEALHCLDSVSGVNGFILVYIAKSKDAVFQKDIEREFGITRGTASKVISLMEKKNLVVRRAVSNDARLKQLILTDEAKNIVSEIDQGIGSFENRLLDGIKEEEVFALLNTLEKMEQNIQKGNKK